MSPQRFSWTPHWQSSLIGQDPRSSTCFPSYPKLFVCLADSRSVIYRMFTCVHMFSITISCLPEETNEQWAMAWIFHDLASVEHGFPWLGNTWEHNMKGENDGKRISMISMMVGHGLLWSHPSICRHPFPHIRMFLMWLMLTCAWNKHSQQMLKSYFSRPNFSAYWMKTSKLYNSRRAPDCPMSRTECGFQLSSRE